MKNLAITFLLFSTTACGDKVYQSFEQAKVDQERLLFSGYFYLDGPDGSYNCIYLDEKAEGVVDIETDCQSLVSVNPENGTIGQFPSVSATSLIVDDQKLRFTRNMNYTSGNDLEEDASGSNITGSRRTDFVIEFVDGRLSIQISVYANSNNNNLNYIVAKRTFKEL